jgi:hypothetical protein
MEAEVTWETAFSIASMGAVLAWIALIFLPRGWPLLPQLIKLVVPVLLAVAYAVIVLVYFFSGEGGFDSLADVRTLFQSDPMLLAGWLHYLAFDLLVGGWIAERADAERVSRFIQAPILFATFMFGPLGWLLFQAVSHGQRLFISTRQGAQA